MGIRSSVLQKTSDLSASLALLIKKEGMSESQIFLKNFQKLLKNRNKKYNFCQIFWANRSFYVCERKSQWAICSKKRVIRSFAHLSWATWGNRSRSHFWHDQPERFAHSRSFVLIDLSKSLKVAHFIWAIWANEQMSEFPTWENYMHRSMFIYKN